MGFDYLGKSALANLKKYKYSAIDLSPVSNYILRHYWNWAVTLFPMWMAPNLITLIGFCFNLISVALIMVFIPDLEQPTHPILYFYFAAGMWLYSTFDNVDGKQARRTNSSSPLGELFDHVCDALNCSVGSIVQIAAMGIGVKSNLALLIPFLSICAFFLSTWEEYHTGTLYLGYINGPTEGLLIACCTMILSGLYGPSIWKLPIASISAFAPLWKAAEPLIPASIYHSMTLLDVLSGFMLVSLVLIHSPPCFLAVARANIRKGKSVIAAFSQVSVIIVYFIAAYFWVTSPYSVVREQHYAIFLLTVGILFGMIAGNIILAHLTKGPFPYYTILFLPLIVGSVAVNVPFFDSKASLADLETKFIYGYFGFSILIFLYWSNRVVAAFCSYLKINCFSIPFVGGKDDDFDDANGTRRRTRKQK